MLSFILKLAKWTIWNCSLFSDLFWEEFLHYCGFSLPNIDWNGKTMSFKHILYALTKSFQTCWLKTLHRMHYLKVNRWRPHLIFWQDDDAWKLKPQKHRNVGKCHEDLLKDLFCGRLEKAFDAKAKDFDGKLSFCYFGSPAVKIKVMNVWLNEHCCLFRLMVFLLLIMIKTFPCHFILIWFIARHPKKKRMKS